MDELNLNIFRASEDDQLPMPKGKSPKHKRGEWFILGPIPGPWIGRAAKASGKSLHVALALWHLAAMTRSQPVQLSRAALDKVGVKPDAARRALAALEREGLVRVERRRGRLPRVTPMEVD